MDIHSFKIGGFAVVDILLTWLGAKYFYPDNTIVAFIILVFISIIIHAIFSIKTRLTTLLEIN